MTERPDRRSAANAVLELDQLRLRYPSSAAWTLDGLTLRIAPGEHLALVGPSGCGKSTVARAALQLLPPPHHLRRIASPQRPGPPHAQPADIAAPAR